MNKNDAIVVKRIGNGFNVFPFTSNSSISDHEIRCFQKKGLAKSVSDDQLTLLEWIEIHFEEIKQNESY